MLLSLTSWFLLYCRCLSPAAATRLAAPQSTFINEIRRLCLQYIGAAAAAHELSSHDHRVTRSASLPVSQPRIYFPVSHCLSLARYLTLDVSQSFSLSRLTLAVSLSHARYFRSQFLIILPYSNLALVVSPSHTRCRSHTSCVSPAVSLPSPLSCLVEMNDRNARCDVNPVHTHAAF